MKTKITLILILWGFFCAYGQVETKFFPKGDAFDQIRPIKDHPKANKRITLPSFDAQKLVDEGKINENIDRPFRFGKGFDTEITLANGEWRNVDEGRLWSMEFQSHGAYSINFVFDQFFLSDSAKLYVTNADGTMLYGPVTSKQNTKNGYFLTDLIQGDDVTIYLFEPNSEKGKSKLTIKRVVHAYKNLFSNMAYGNLGGSESCNNDIACFPVWDEESDAVALVLLSNGTEWCSGSLLMTANQSFRPYFLSAFHCIDSSIPYGSLSATEISDAENWMFKFQYKKVTCGGSTSTTGVTYNGAVFRAAWNATDFSLMEMDNSPVGDTGISWLGWDRSGNTPTSGTGIHHPAGDVMKISFDVNQFQTSSWGGTNNHWLLAFDDGVVQKGSSGSPILDQNDRVVGQLHGNQNYNQDLTFCEQSRAEYGRFNNSWRGNGTDTTRLSNWLDPCDLGVETTNTTRTPYVSGASQVCSSGSTYTVSNIPNNGTVIWSCSPNLSFDNQPNSPKVFIANGIGSGWLQASIVNTCGDTITLPRKNVVVGVPDHDLLSIEILDGYLTSCDYTSATAIYSGTAGIDAFEWYMPNALNWTIREESGSGPDNKYVEIEYWEDPVPSYEDIYIRAHNSCGWSNWKSTAWPTVSCRGYLMVISPNPVTDEATIKLVNKKDNTPIEFTEWDYEIYDTMQGMKEKKTKLKSAESKINTLGWKDGIYIIRAMIDKELVTGKLVVKH